MRKLKSVPLLFLFIVVSGLTSCSRQSSVGSVDESVEEWGAEAPVDDVIRSNDSESQVQLKLTLKPGDRFPLRKVVEQDLIQDSLTGSANKIQTRLELLFAISVLDRVEDRTKLGVRYDRVTYSHRIGEEVIRFDSTRPAAQLPVNLLPYRDMVGDGFTFWLGPDNQIVSVDGFTEFLNRCLQNVPEQARNEVALGLEAGSGESGIANFIDNSIGLLPYGAAQQLGDSWERPSHIGRPVPMHVRNQYTLTHLDDELATITVRGQITPSTTMNASDEQTGVRVTVTGGETQGNCTIFRETGLPQKSRVEQNIDMTVMMSGALQFNQRKHITTTIESFPVHSTQVPTVISFGDQQPHPIGRPQHDPNLRPASGP